MMDDKTSMQLVRIEISGLAVFVSELKLIGW